MARQYGDACGISRALNLVGDRWSLLVVRELLYGQKRFTDLRSALAGVSPNVLTQRLGELVDRGIVQRRRPTPFAAIEIYGLTEVGQKLEAVLLALGHWGSRVAPPSPGSQLSTESLLLAMKSTRRPGSRAPSGEYELDIDGDMVTAAVSDDELKFRRGPSSEPVGRISAGGGTLRAVIFADRTVAGALRSRDLRFTGDSAALTAYLSMFERPQLFGT